MFIFLVLSGLEYKLGLFVMVLFDDVDSVASHKATLISLLSIWPEKVPDIQGGEIAGKDFLIKLNTSIKFIIDFGDAGIKLDCANALLSLRDNAKENKTLYLHVHITLKNSFLKDGVLTDDDMKIADEIQALLRPSGMGGSPH
jgi:hypothetical protein